MEESQPVNSVSAQGNTLPSYKSQPGIEELKVQMQNFFQIPSFL